MRSSCPSAGCCRSARATSISPSGRAPSSRRTPPWPAICTARPPTGRLSPSHRAMRRRHCGTCTAAWRVRPSRRERWHPPSHRRRGVGTGDRLCDPLGITGGTVPHRCALHRSGCNRVGCSARPRHGARRPHRQSAQARDRGRPRPVGQRARRRARHLLVVQSDKPRPGSGGHARLPVRRSAPIRHVPPYRPRRGRGAVAPHPLLSRAAAARRPRPPLHESRSLSRRMRSHCARRSRTACSYPLSVGS